MIRNASRRIHAALSLSAALALVAGLVVACSAGSRKDGAPAKSPSMSEASPADARPGGAGGQPGPYAPPPPPPMAPVTTGTAGGSAPNERSIAIGKAGQDLDTGQRELEVAAGDCRNACRALGSMDRAAGKLCELAAGSNDAPRCDDAKRRLYSARDKVRATCGRCPDGPSVDRNAPIPSVR